MLLNNILSYVFIFTLWDFFWFFLINCYYYTFSTTPFHKSVMCSVATCLALVASIYNYDVLFTSPWKQYPFVNISNSFMRMYLIIDLYYNIRYTQLRKDILFHHIYCYVVYHCNHEILIMCFLTINEIISVWNIFPCSAKVKNLLRIISIFPIRFYIWYSTYLFSSLPGIDYRMFFWTGYGGTILMILLDMYWLYLSIRLSLKHE